MKNYEQKMNNKEQITANTEPITDRQEQTNPQIEGFIEALRQRQPYRESTIKGHVKNIGYFMRWLNDNQLYEIENVRYKNMLEYAQYEQGRHMDTATVNQRLHSISLYFDYLKTIAPPQAVLRNPARSLHIKGKLQKITEQPLSYQELGNLYQAYKTLDKPVAPNVQAIAKLLHCRNLVIVGLLIWQALHSGELNKLEATHLKLDEGKIYIPATTRSNSRELHLQPQQILDLHTYLNGGIRDKLKTKGDKLFAVGCADTVKAIVEELKGINPQIRNARHIRASVILHWLRQHNKRQVQYMLGHRYIDSTERYAIQETETLTDLLSKHHPFG
jgi:integrase/recombinase XerD